MAVSDSGDRNERLGEAFKFQEKIVTPIYAVIAKVHRSIPSGLEKNGMDFIFLVFYSSRR